MAFTAYSVTSCANIFLIFLMEHWLYALFPPLNMSKTILATTFQGYTLFYFNRFSVEIPYSTNSRCTMCHSRAFLKPVVMAKGIYKKRNHLSLPHHHGNRTGIVIVPDGIDKLSSVSPIAIELLLHHSIIVFGKDCVLIVHKEKPPFFFLRSLVSLRTPWS